MLMILYYQLEAAFAEALVVVVSAPVVFVAAHPDPIEEVLGLVVFVVDLLAPVVVRDFVVEVWAPAVWRPDLLVPVVGHDHFHVEHSLCYCYVPDHVCDDRFFPDFLN